MVYPKKRLSELLFRHIRFNENIIEKYRPPDIGASFARSCNKITLHACNYTISIALFAEPRATRTFETISQSDPSEPALVKVNFY